MSVPPLVVCAAAAALYVLGGQGRVGSTTRGRRWREASFYTGMLFLLVVLEPPFDRLADESFSIHMAQHVVLLTIVPPLVVLGRPWPRMWMPFPTRIRRTAAREIARGRWSAPLRAAARVLTRPPVALAVMSATVGVWHVPALYDAAVRNNTVHFGEHACFLVTALLYWAPMLELPPVRARIDHLRRAALFAGAAVPGWILALVLTFATTPLYGAYVSLQHRPGGISALADQQIAAGVMLVPGSAAFFIGFFVSVYRWLEPATGLETQPEELIWT
jgi:putative membrane protein